MGTAAFSSFSFTGKYYTNYTLTFTVPNFASIPPYSIDVVEYCDDILIYISLVGWLVGLVGWLVGCCNLAGLHVCLLLVALFND